ncbi:MAG: aminopeptidase P family protein [Planctomycetota bacterium]|jgi:Xaa-Pro aminopeptidase
MKGALALQCRAAVANRKRFRAEMPDDLIALTGADEVRRNADTMHPFRQRSDFLWLTGYESPGARLILHPGGEVLFIPRVDRRHLVWVGTAPTPKTARRDYGFRTVRYVDEFGEQLARLARRHKRVHTLDDSKPAIRKLARGARCETRRLREAITSLRVIKNPHEVALVRRAAKVTSDAHAALMAGARPGMVEHQAYAIFEQVVLDRGMRDAYQPIVGSAANAAVIHYGALDRKMRSGEFVLVDAAAECHGYAADVTRTFPLGGRFSRFHREFYELVLETQLAALAEVRPGATARGVHELVSSRLAEGLLDMKVLKGSADEVRERGTMSIFLPHGIMHQIGLDVHDVCPRPKRGKPTRENSSAALPFKPGMTLAVEAACYFVAPLLRDGKLRRKHRATVNWGLVDKRLDFGGVRTEDDVLITKNGCEVLTSAPKTVADIVAAVRG